MRILLDHCVDIRFRNLLEGYDVAHTKDLGWENLTNGKLLSAAEENDFEVFVTVDKNLRYQQNIGKRKLAVITLSSRFTGLDHIRPLAPAVIRLLNDGVTVGTDYVVTNKDI